MKLNGRDNLRGNLTAPVFLLFYVPKKFLLLHFLSFLLTHSSDVYSSTYIL